MLHDIVMPAVTTAHWNGQIERIHTVEFLSNDRIIGFVGFGSVEKLRFHLLWACDAIRDTAKYWSVQGVQELQTSARGPAKLKNIEKFQNLKIFQRDRHRTPRRWCENDRKRFLTRSKYVFLFRSQSATPTDKKIRKIPPGLTAPTDPD